MRQRILSTAIISNISSEQHATLNEVRRASVLSPIHNMSKQSLPTQFHKKPIDKILMLKRSKKSKTFKEYWQFPEGHIEFKENPLDALKREIKEETSLDLQSAKLLGVSSDTLKEFNKTIFHFIRIVYDCQVSGEVKLSEKHSRFLWASIDDVENLKLVKGLNWKEIKKLLR